MNSKRILLITILACIAAMVFASSETARLKARYYFTQGSLEAARGNTDAAYEYFKKAYETDPAYKDAAFTYGNQRLFVRNDTLQTSTELIRSLDMMKDYLDEYPLDLYATQMYGYLTTRLDTIEEAIRVYEKIYGLMPSETQILMNLADVYMMNGQPAEAVKAVERYEKIEGKNPGLSMKKITFMLAGGDTIASIQEVEDLINSNPRDYYSRILKGNLYDVIGLQDSVYKAYKEAEKLAPDNGAVKMSLANYYREAGDSVMLDNMVYEALLSEDFEEGDKISILGDYIQKLIDDKGDKSRGDYLFSVLRQQYPLEPDLLDMAARYSASKGNFSEAAEEIGYAIGIDPSNERYRLQQMSYYLADSRYDEIVGAYEEAKKVMQPSVVLKNLYAASATQLSDYKKARGIISSLIDEVNPEILKGSQEDLERIRKTMPLDTLEWVSSLYCNLGDLDYKNSDPAKGFESYERSLYFNPENALTLNNFAYFLAEENKDLEKAKEMSLKSLELAGNNPTYLDTYAWILYKLGELKEAEEYQHLAIQLAKDNGEENEEYEYHLKEIEKALAAKDDMNK